jgi:hypothetical protein
MIEQELRACRTELQTMLAADSKSAEKPQFVEVFQRMIGDAGLDADVLARSVGPDLAKLLAVSPDNAATLTAKGLEALEFMQKVQESYKSLNFTNIKTTVAHQSAVLTTALQLRAQVVMLAATMENFLATHAALDEKITNDATDATHTVISSEGGGGASAAKYSLNAIKTDPLTIHHTAAQDIPVAKLLMKVARAAAELQTPIPQGSDAAAIATRQVLLSQTQLISRNFAQAFMLAVQLKDLRAVFPSTS